MVVVALLSVDLVESVDLVSVDLVVNCIRIWGEGVKIGQKIAVILNAWSLVKA